MLLLTAVPEMKCEIKEFYCLLSFFLDLLRCIMQFVTVLRYGNISA